MLNIFRRLFSKNDAEHKDNQRKQGRVFGSTNDEIAQFFPSLGEVDFSDTDITIRNYPFKPAAIFKQQVIKIPEISDIDTDSSPPTIKIGDELIFISANHKERLKEFVNINKIPTVRRSYIWSWILEPFLDTEFTDENKEKLNSLLAAYGLFASQIDEIRREVESQMYKYNYDTMLWEWCDLNALDVLLAMRPKYSDDEFAAFYKKVMKIALLPSKTT